MNFAQQKHLHQAQATRATPQRKKIQVIEQHV